jgi:uncharacterized protein (TIRG00374 family)
MTLRPTMVLRVAVTGTIVYVLVRTIDLRAVWEVLASAKAAPIALALALSAADRLFMFGKWLPLVRARIPGVRLIPAARVYLASGLAQLLLPATVGADAMRAAAMGRSRGAIAEAGASIVAERMLGVLASSLMSAVALAFAVREGLPLRFLVPWTACSVGVSVLVLLLPFNRTVSSTARRVTHGIAENALVRFVGRVGAGYAAYRERPRLLLVVGLLSVVEQCIPIAIMATVARSAGIHVTVPMVFVTMPLVMFVTRLPISMGGIGVGDAAIVYLLGLFGMANSDALAISILCRVVDLPAMVLPGLVLWGDLVHPQERSPD